MALFNLFRKDKDPFREAITGLEVDIMRGTCGGAKLGQPVPRSVFFCESLEESGVFKSEPSGFEIGLGERGTDAAANVAGYFCIDVERFTGVVMADGRQLNADACTTETIRGTCGEPWWEDVDEEETLWFYELPQVEIQFEFGPGGSLDHITVTKDRLLADARQRDAYGVDRPWTF